MTTIASEIDAIFKDKYADDVPTVANTDPVAWSTLKKTTDFRGRRKSFAIQSGMTPGVSHTFSHAQDNANAEAFDEFLVTRRKDYLVISVDGETYESAEGDGAQVDYVVRQVETMRKTAKWRMNQAFYGRFGRAFARLSASAGGGGTDTLLVRDPLDLRFLSRNMVVVSSTTDGTSGSVDANPGVVGAVNRRTGQIVNASGNWNASFANSDYLFLEGDFGAGFHGFRDWVPDDDPSATAFFSLVRTLDSRYGGNRATATVEDNTLENFLLRAISESSIESSCRNMRLYWHTSHNTQLIRELGSSVNYDKTVTKAMTSSGPHATVGFKSITMLVGDIELEIVPDRDAPRHRGFLCDPESMGFEGLGEATRPLTYKDDSFMWMREHDADSMESRMGTKGNFVFSLPSNFANLNLEALTNPT